MNDLYRALGDISSIRRQVANTSEFRGYGPATLATTGVLAIIAAACQELWVPDASRQMSAYLLVWVLTAVLSITVTGVQMYTRARRIHSALSDEMIRMAVEQFLPAITAGLLLTIVVLCCVSQSSWMLPGLWQIIFSLGIWSSCRFLPKPVMAAGMWYLLTGLACIGIGSYQALSPWAMGLPFGAGQLLIATILRFATPEAEGEY